MFISVGKSQENKIDTFILPSKQSRAYLWDLNPTQALLVLSLLSI